MYRLRTARAWRCVLKGLLLISKTKYALNYTISHYLVLLPILILQHLIADIPRSMQIEPQLLSGKNVMIAAHGNSLRSIIMYLDKLTSQEVIKVYHLSTISFYSNKKDLNTLTCSSLVRLLVQNYRPEYQCSTFSKKVDSLEGEVQLHRPRLASMLTPR